MFEAVEIGHTLSKDEYDRKEPQLRTELIMMQSQLRKAQTPVVLVLAGDDRPGRDDVLHLLHDWLDPRFLRVHAFTEPSAEQRERPWMWRYWTTLPPQGRIGIYLNAWSAEVLTLRIRGDLEEAEWLRRVDNVRRFEQMLVDEGALVLKFWLHLKQGELKKQLEAAEKHPDREWRIHDDDWAFYKFYDENLAQVENFLQKTTTRDAPWHLVESSDPRYRDVTVAETILASVHAALGTPAKSDLEAPEDKDAEDKDAEDEGADVSPDPARPAVGPVATGEARTLTRSSDEASSRSDSDPHTLLDTLDMSKSLAKKDYERKLGEQQRRLSELARCLHQRRATAVLVFEGWDAGGKGGTIRRMVRAMNPHMYQIEPISAPTADELAHHYLWRFWNRLPRAGRVTIFDRSWYGRVLVERVEGLASETAWQRAYQEINAFEQQLVERGILLQKFWLHISKEEQAERFAARENTPYKRFKITEDDYRNRERWTDYERAANDMFLRTSTPQARWQVLPANDKRFARVEVLQRFCDDLESHLEASSS